MQATIGITAGDPAGIGLEVVLKSIPPLLQSARWILFTDREIFERNAARLQSPLQVRWVDCSAELSDDPVLFLRDLRGDTSSVQWGKLQTQAGRRAIEYLQAAGAEALGRRIDAIVTAPVSKEAIGGAFHGQTDYLAEQARVQEYAMAFFSPTFKVVLATVHMPLREALGQITKDRYVRLIRFVNTHLPNQRIAVA